MVQFVPAKGVIARIQQLGLVWPEVVEDLSAASITPVVGYETRLRYAGSKVEAFIEPGMYAEEDVLWVVGLRIREKVTHIPRQEQVVGHERKHRRSGHGGSGQRWPTTWKELISRIQDHPDVELHKGGKHLNVMLHGRQVQTLPLTASDHRALLNACQVLRGAGIDVRREE